MIKITKNKDCAGKTYYTAKLGETHLVGGGDTRNEARDELLENIVEYIDYLEDELKNAIVPKFKIGQRVFMIPTQFNGLQNIVEYLVFTYELSSLGIRIGLSIKEKQKGIESIYSATEEMINNSIFATKEEAEARLKELNNE